MDGTFIPLDGSIGNVRDLVALRDELSQRSIELMYVTGRDQKLVGLAIDEHKLPIPTWMICDVGSSIYRLDDGGRHTPVRGYQQHLRDLVGKSDVNALAEHLGCVRELRKQELEKQGEFKLSFYTLASNLRATSERVRMILQEQSLPYELIASVDPFTGDGLMDLLPTRVSKAYALRWWAAHTKCDQESIVFAGDSGNDLAALTAGYRSIVVGNASPSLVNEVRESHASAGWTDRLHVASESATSGVLEGLRHFAKR